MAVTDSPRFGLTRWSAGSDPLTRLQLDGDHAALDDRAAMFVRNTLAARPATGVVGRIFEVTGDVTTNNNGRIFWDTGAAWQEVAVLDGSASSRIFTGSVRGASFGVVGEDGRMHLIRAMPGAGRYGIEIQGGSDTTGSPLGGVLRAYHNDDVRGGVLESIGQHAFAGGTLAAPGIAFSDDMDTGLLRAGTNLLDVAAGGLRSARFHPDGIQVGDGTVASPSMSFYFDPTTGIYRVNGRIHIGDNGVGVVSFADSGTKRQLLPVADNDCNLGNVTLRFTEVHAVNGTIQTSDEDEKDGVAVIDGDEAVDRVRRTAAAAIRFKWRDGGQRYHAGFSAQKVGEEHGDDTAAYIDPIYEADARINPYQAQEPTQEFLDDYLPDPLDPDADDDHAEHEREVAEAREKAQREWVEARERFDTETVEIRNAPKGLRPAEMIPDLYAALAKALDRIDQLEARVAALESA